jgi:hypothetical protein
LKGRLVVKNFEMLVLWVETIVSSQTFSHMFVLSSFTFVIVSFSRKKFCFGMTLESPSRAVSKITSEGHSPESSRSSLQHCIHRFLMS